MSSFIHYSHDEIAEQDYHDDDTCITEQGGYLRVQSSEHLVHIYQQVSDSEQLCPTLAQIQHNGRTYKLTWIEDEQW